MKYLAMVIERENILNGLFKLPQYDITRLTAEDARKLNNSILASLSPENLTCDGELPAAEVRRRAVIFRGALRDLAAMGFEVAEEA